MLTQKIKFTEMRENQENQRSMSSVSQNHSSVFSGLLGDRVMRGKDWLNEPVFHVFMLISSKRHEKVSLMHVSPMFLIC